jgi:trehalose 6-phosphate synthase/phosphatase
MRLLVISNRLPFTVREDGEDIRFDESNGGLVTGLSGYLDHQKQTPGFECLWIGWPGTSVPAEKQARVTAMAMEKHRAVPVFIPAAEMDVFYHGFCNHTLWPLFHYFPSMVAYDESTWQTYKRVNEAFAEAVLSVVRPGDVIWVHDYQLMLLPKLLRRGAPDNRIGFFLHIPFPSYEIFRLLPSGWAREILQGMLGSDLVGFHTHDYTQYFLRCVYRALGFEHNLGNIATGDKLVKADTFPLGIDFEKFHEAAAGPAVTREAKALESQLNGCKIVFSVDRLDYTKGILHRLKGFEEFLTKNPAWIGKVAFILSVVPSRVEEEHYQQMKKEIDEAVGKINGRFGNLGWTPILYQYRSLPFENLVSMYALSHVAMITPLRDGMNLVAKEFLACRRDGTGVLILSEMAGAARELGEAIQVNPNHSGEVAAALLEALTMEVEEQVRRNRAMQERLRLYTAQRWAEDFLRALGDFQSLQRKLATLYLGAGLRNTLISRYHTASRRLILLDYDGTLVPFAPHPQQARPDAKLLALLTRLAAAPGHRVYLVSGRDRRVLQEWFGGTGMGLIAEHGVWILERGPEWTLMKPLNAAWKSQIMPILRLYVDRLPGSFLEEKEFSIAWHYRKADPELGAHRAKELIDDLVHFTANIDVQVLEGKKVVEIRNAGVNKGNAALFCQNRFQPDFFLAIGDDQTDEDLFKAMPEDAFTVRVGLSISYADYCLYNYMEVRTLLEDLMGKEQPAAMPLKVV